MVSSDWSPTTLILSLLITACLSDVELIWQDEMEDYTTHWTASGAVQQVSNIAECNSGCVWIQGYTDADDWIIRTTALPIITNLDAYTSFQVQFDVILSDIETNNFCTVSYKYDIDSDYTPIRSFSSDGAVTPTLHSSQTGSISIHPSHRTTAQTLYLKLETDGNSADGGDWCYFDNISLFGVFTDKNTIFYDDMSDFAATGWRTSHNLAADQMISDPSCADGGCIKLNGHNAMENTVSIDIRNISHYFDLFVEYDVFHSGVESDDGCQILYKYDTDPTDEYYLIQNLVGGNGNVLSTNNIVTIRDDPQYMNSSVLSIQLKAFGSSTTGGDNCYFDNVYVKGTLLNATNRQQLMDDIGTMRSEYQDTEHIIVLGDFGGQDAAPYYTSEQAVTADMMSTISKYYRVHGVIALGDNIYNSGVQNEYDPRFQTTFENVYTHHNLLSIPWYITTGNHDYRSNITAQVEYTKHSTRWTFPSLYYTKSWYFGANNEIEVLWVGLDTYILCGSVTDGSTQEDCIPKDLAKAEEHWRWLNATLNASTATFKLVGGHTPIYSYAHHGPVAQLIDQLSPMLEHYGVNAYLFGHDHVLQFIEDNTTSGRFLQHIGSGAAHGCRDSFLHINSEWNPSVGALKYMECVQGGFVRLAINVKKITMQAFYYLPTSYHVDFFSGIWNRYGEYRFIHDILYGETMAPTKEPTFTTNPTQAPSSSTNAPSVFPSLMPSLSPSNNPTYMPSLLPTLLTMDPSNVPSKESIAPIQAPTAMPTDNPSPDPSTNPIVLSTFTTSREEDGGNGKGEVIEGVSNTVLYIVGLVVMSIVACLSCFVCYLFMKKSTKLEEQLKDEKTQMTHALQCSYDANNDNAPKGWH